MKTLIETLTVQLAIYSILLLVLAGIAYGGNESTNPPFVAEEFMMEEESYIDDIPFNTKAIADQVKMEEAMNESFGYNDEEYIDDIPFNTEYIADNYLFEEAMAVDVDFEDEAYVDDIPSDVIRIALNNTQNLVLVK